MNTQEIRAQFPPVAIWMADATIREARSALTGNTGWDDVKRADYNLPEVEMAGAVLSRMFDTYPAAIRLALLSMPQEMDGLHASGNYFDEFLKAFQAKKPSGVHIRRPDWFLEKC